MDLDELERLTRLRDAGVLTNEEFEREKARVLAGESVHVGDTTGRPVKSRGKGWIVLLALAVPGVIVVALLVLGGFFDGIRSGNGGSVVGSFWKVSRTVDPMTDAEVITAAANFDVEPGFVVEAAIKCEGGAQITYNFATFDRKESPVALRGTPTENGSEVGFFTMRLADEEARKYANLDQKFSNAVVFGPAGQSNDLGSGMVMLTKALMAASVGAALPDSTAAARVERLVITFPLVSGDATIEVNQTEPSLRQVLDTCLRNIPERKVAPTPAPPPENEAAVAPTNTDVSPPNSEPEGDPENTGVPGGKSMPDNANPPADTRYQQTEG